MPREVYRRFTQTVAYQAEPDAKGLIVPPCTPSWSSERCSRSPRRPRGLRRPTSSACTTKGCARSRQATRAPPRRRGRPAMRSRAIRRSWFTSARRRRRQARRGKRRTATAATCARRPTPPTAPTSNSGSRGWRRRGAAARRPRRRRRRPPRRRESSGPRRPRPRWPRRRRPPPRRGPRPPATPSSRAARGRTGQRLEPLQHHGGRVGERRGAASGRRRAVRRRGQLGRGRHRSPAQVPRPRHPGRRFDTPRSPTQYEQAMADGPRNERDAKIAFVGSAVAAAVSATFFILDAKLGGTPRRRHHPGRPRDRRHGRLAMAF